ncbi:alpha/beta fold hydrolase [Hydrogenophaga sp. BPS33]|uniref:alpha/beta fold hydrolase n=1 Tax=Hydrogenophaga sp. BPS33 TaxID=2651974 RepID=UPI00131F653F|nr:alpha/beta fold hydrolase [Hydrogenophaga sp. BPS33]QHE85192.1 alpha/beta hydrolase [Hydrogenophaga sp. BPS33]
MDHRFEFQGIAVHAAALGPERGTPLLLLHGSGAGASSIGNWRKVLEPLAEAGFRVHAMDLVGFGRSGRKPTPPFFDYDLWLAQCGAMLERIPGERVGVIGHSLSGSLALRLAAQQPRVDRVMTTATMGAAFTANACTLATWTCPTDRDQLMAVARRLIHDERLIDSAYLDNRAQVLFNDGYADYYAAMFSGDRQRFIDRTVLSPAELAAITGKVLMLHGKNDRGYPAEALTLALARGIAQADAVLLANCSHSVAFEQPQKFVWHATRFFDRETSHA